MTSLHPMFNACVTDVRVNNCDRIASWRKLAQAFARRGLTRQADTLDKTCDRLGAVYGCAQPRGTDGVQR